MKKLFLDYEKYTETRDFKTECSYFYHLGNDGLASLIEMAAFACVCRQCEEAPCVKACPKEALEKQEGGIVKRHNMRCIGCKSCVIACPFGTIYTEAVNHIASKCDLCVERCNGSSPLCVRTASAKGVLEYAEIEADEEKHNFAVGKNLIVHAVPWKKVLKEKKK